MNNCGMSGEIIMEAALETSREKVVAMSALEEILEMSWNRAGDGRRYKMKMHDNRSSLPLPPSVPTAAPSPRRQGNPFRAPTQPATINLPRLLPAAHHVPDTPQHAQRRQRAPHLPRPPRHTPQTRPARLRSTPTGRTAPATVSSLRLLSVVRSATAGSDGCQVLFPAIRPLRTRGPQPTAT